jgi:hypothetical protein
VPLIRLIAAPEKFQGILVRTLGFVRLEFEGNVIYPYKEDYKNGLVGNGIWLDINNKDIEQNYKHGMKYFLIVATFDANRRGHFGMWSGSLTNIKRFEIWSDPANPRSEKIGQALKREKKKEVKSKRKAMKW